TTLGPFWSFARARLICNVGHKMRFLLISYIVLFATVVLAAVAAAFLPQEPDKKKESVLEHIADGLTAAVLFAGMIFVFIGVDAPYLKNIWKVVVPILGGWALFASWKARRHAAVTGEMRENPAWAIFADIGSLVLLLPALALNLFFAFR
ncbi:MAG: hypothetical protein V4671_25450, partial [Armatimonadota bacterium]